jgi:hypothetical protein
MNFTNQKNLGYCTPTSCPKAGIKIHPSDNDNKQSIFDTQQKQPSNNIHVSHLKKPVSFYNTNLNQLDLNIDNYSLQDLYNLFNITDNILDETNLRQAKQIVLKMHPDKSRLDPKYFLFFSKAYQHMYSIYEFQNKSSKKNSRVEEYYDEGEARLLDQVNQKFKQSGDKNGFNSWFNQQFEKHQLQEEQVGYGDWLKSNEGIHVVNGNVTKNNMNEMFEQQKKQIQTLSVYTGVTDLYANTFGGTLLNSTDNFSGTSGGLEYTDLRQAYMETVIPVTQDDFNNIPKYKNVNEYKSHRDNINATPLSKEESERMLHQSQRNMDAESAALAYKYARDAEKMKTKQQSFWGEIKQLTG